MKFFVLLLAFLFTACSGSAENVASDHSNEERNIWKVYHDPALFRQATERANVAGKISVVMIGSTTCPPCTAARKWWNHHKIANVRYVEYESDDLNTDTPEDENRIIHKYASDSQRKEHTGTLPICAIEKAGKILYKAEDDHGRSGCLEKLHEELERILASSQGQQGPAEMTSVQWKIVSTSADFWKEVHSAKRVVALFSSPTCDPCHRVMEWWQTQRVPADITFVNFALQSDDATSTPALQLAWNQFRETAEHFLFGRGAPVPICGIVRPIGEDGHIHDINQHGYKGCSIELAKEIGILK